MALDFTDPMFLCLAGGAALGMLALIIQTLLTLSCIRVMNQRVKRFTRKS